MNGESCPLPDSKSGGDALARLIRAKRIAVVGLSDDTTRAGGIWLQSGIVSPESRKLADEAGVDFIENRCLMVEIMHAGSE